MIRSSGTTNSIVDSEPMEKTLLDLSREIQAISKTGLSFSKDPYDFQRFKQLSEIAAELIANHSIYSEEFVNRVFSAESGYVTPKIDVRGAIFTNDKILMVREKATGAWTLPGGYVEINESLSQAVEREVLEESGFVVRLRKLPQYMITVNMATKLTSTIFTKSMSCAIWWVGQRTPTAPQDRDSRPARRPPASQDFGR